MTRCVICNGECKHFKRAELYDNLPSFRVVQIIFIFRKIIALEHNNWPLKTVDPGPFLQ